MASTEARAIYVKKSSDLELLALVLVYRIPAKWKCLWQMPEMFRKVRVVGPG